LPVWYIVDGWSEAIPINCLCEDDGFREEFNRSYAHLRTSAPRTTLPDDMRGAFTTPWIPRNGGQKLAWNFGKISKPGFLTARRRCLIFLPGRVPSNQGKTVTTVKG